MTDYTQAPDLTADLFGELNLSPSHPAEYSLNPPKVIEDEMSIRKHGRKN